jgi:TniQ protein
VTNMLPRERAEQILAEHAAGTPVRAIARAYRHSGNTVRDYVHRRRIPGEPAARPDGFGPFAAYCRQRLADDPHLRAPALLAEVSRAGFHGGTSTFYRALDRHRIQPHPCPDCHIARISGYAPLITAPRPRASPLPLPAAPVTGETLASFLGRLATVNHTSPDTLLEFLPPWFRVKTRWHDDRWQHDQLTPWAGDAAARLAVISGTTAPAIRHALPAFAARSGQPARAVTACRRCTAARHIPQPVPVHLPAHHQVCLRHGIWLSEAGTPQFSVGECPDIIAAERQAGPPAPPPLHHRAADLRQDPGRTHPRRAGPDHTSMETPAAGPHRSQPANRHRGMPASTVPGSGIPRNHHHRRRSDPGQPQNPA